MSSYVGYMPEYVGYGVHDLGNGTRWATYELGYDGPAGYDWWRVGPSQA